MKLLTSLILFLTSLVLLNLPVTKLNNTAVAQTQKIALFSDKGYVKQGRIYQEQGKYDLALSQYNKAIKIHPYSVSAYYNRGILYFVWKKYELSLADFDKVIQIVPNHFGAYGNRGNAYLHLGKEKLALRNYNYAIKLNPNSARGYFNRGYVYNLQGKRRLAEADFQKAKDLFMKKGDKINALKASEYAKGFSLTDILKRYLKILRLKTENIINYTR